MRCTGTDPQITKDRQMQTESGKVKRLEFAGR